MLRRLALGIALVVPELVAAQGRGGQPAAAPSPGATLLVPARAWEGTDAPPRAGWAVLVRGDRIEAVGPLAAMGLPPGTPTIELPGTTLIPGLIEGHSHLLLHPYNETSWDDQV